MSRSIDQLYDRTELTTLQSLEHWGFSPVLIDRLFRPFLGGILLDSRLTASSRMFEFVFKMMSEGDTAVPAAGMGAIPDQLAARLPSGSLRLNARVQSIETAPLRLTLAGGEELSPKAVIVAVEGPEAHRLLNEVPEPASRRVTCLYFAAEKAPLPGPWLYLNGNNQPPVNNAAILSELSGHYAPPGAALISATVLGKPGTKDIALAGEVRDQMVRWFGPAAHRWRHLKTYTIEHAQPAVTPLEDRSPRFRPGLYLCGDYRSTPSIHHAMRSGRLAAEALLADGAAG
jgi:phytoene dehydrogenase-like protein